VAADRAIVMVRRHRVERALAGGRAGGQRPKPAARRDLPHEPAHSGRRRGPKSHPDRRRLPIERNDQRLFQIFPGGHARTLGRWLTIVNGTYGGSVLESRSYRRRREVTVRRLSRKFQVDAATNVQVAMLAPITSSRHSASSTVMALIAPSRSGPH